MSELPNYECYPLRNLQELVDWSPSEKDVQASNTIVPLVLHQIKAGPRVILCHDMKGGYLDDKYLHGSEEQDAYRFFHWSQIDYFIYFSHYLVTIPPVPWITAGHRNGVPVLGTFITEYQEGFNVMKQILSDPLLMEKVVQQLKTLTKFFQFDGWLLNIENEIENIPQLFHFIEELKSACKQINPHSIIIWYDSVLHKPNEQVVSELNYPDDRQITNKEGLLCWQNELNENNYSFFERCDGIFLNYDWKKDSLIRSCQLAESVRRRFDVYVGIDVFGRGESGYGEMETGKATAEIVKRNLSIALFAPGWVHEHLTDLNLFTDLEYEFWKRLQLPDRHVPCRLPLTSSFCQGFGNSFFCKGFRLKKQSWHNLHLQQVQPNHRCGQIYVKDAFEGGGCLQMLNFDQSLLECWIQITNRCFINIVYKRLDQESSNNENAVDSESSNALNDPIDPFLRLQHQLNLAIKQNNRQFNENNDLSLNLVGTNPLIARQLQVEEVSKDELLHQHLQRLEVTLLPINGWNSKCFEIEQPLRLPTILQQVFVKPPSDLKPNCLLIGKFTISCLNDSCETDS